MLVYQRVIRIESWGNHIIINVKKIYNGDFSTILFTINPHITNNPFINRHWGLI